MYSAFPDINIIWSHIFGVLQLETNGSVFAVFQVSNSSRGQINSEVKILSEFDILNHRNDSLTGFQ